MRSRLLQDISSRRLQDFFSILLFVFKTSCKMSSRRLQDVFKTYFQHVLKTSRKTKKCYTEDVLKMSSRHVLKTSSRRLEDQQIFAGYIQFLSQHFSYFCFSSLKLCFLIIFFSFIYSFLSCLILLLSFKIIWKKKILAFFLNTWISISLSLFAT